MTKKIKASRKHQETSAEEPRASRATSVGTYVHSDIRLITIVNSLSILPPIITSSIPTTLPDIVPFVMEPMPTSASPKRFCF